MARYSYSRSIPPKFEHKLRRHKQRFRKIATTVVLDKDDNLSWSRLQWHRSCHSNDMPPLPILLPAVFRSTSTNLRIILNRTIDFLKKIKTLEINRPFMWPFSFTITDILYGNKRRATIRQFFIASFVFTSGSLSLLWNLETIPWMMSSSYL